MDACFGFSHGCLPPDAEAHASRQGQGTVRVACFLTLSVLQSGRVLACTPVGRPCNQRHGLQSCLNSECDFSRHHTHQLRCTKMKRCSPLHLLPVHPWRIAPTCFSAAPALLLFHARLKLLCAAHPMLMLLFVYLPRGTERGNRCTSLHILMIGCVCSLPVKQLLRLNMKKMRRRRTCQASSEVRPARLGDIVWATPGGSACAKKCPAAWQCGGWVADKAHSQQSCSNQGLPLSCTPHPFVTLNVAAANSGGPQGYPTPSRAAVARF